MIDIITVVFQDELPILKVQAQSVEQYCADLGVQNIYVIVNDHDTVADCIDPAWWGARQNLVKIIPRSHYHGTWIQNGWVTQQILKLLAAATSSNRWSMVLDAKTVLIQPVQIQRLFNEQGQVAWGTLPIPSVFESARHIANHLFDIELQQMAGPGGVPFLFHNSTVRDLIAAVEQQTAQDFVDWFQEAGTITEFVLYSAYVQARDGNLTQAYTSKNTAYSVCNICHSEVAQFDQKFCQANQHNVLTVSIHRRAWSQLTPDQRTRYRDFLIAHGITQAEYLL